MRLGAVGLGAFPVVVRILGLDCGLGCFPVGGLDVGDLIMALAAGDGGFDFGFDALKS